MVRKDEVTEQSWSDYYPEWFKNHNDYMSAFKVTVDNRIKNLIARGILKKGTTKGTYQLNAELSKDEWNTITGVDKLPPQKDLVIKSILPLKSKCIVCGEHKKIAQAEKNRCPECLIPYFRYYIYKYIIPYI